MDCRDFSIVLHMEFVFIGDLSGSAFATAMPHGVSKFVATRRCDARVEVMVRTRAWLRVQGSWTNVYAAVC